MSTSFCSKGPSPNQLNSVHKVLASPPIAWAYWDGTPLPKSSFLRWGYSTGACAAALLTASYLTLQGSPCKSSIPILFADGVVRTLPLSAPIQEWPGFLVLRKNGGDDPDCTHGVLLCGRLLPFSKSAARFSEDLTLKIGRAQVVLHAVSGIGLATKKGLDCSPGHWAISRGAQQLITTNLWRAGLRQGQFFGEIAIIGGAKIAQHTLNPKLGVIGGLSLLGTSGLVRPFSSDAYVATIRLCVRSLADCGYTSVAFCTGGRTKRAAIRWSAAGFRPYSPLPDEAFISIADFIGNSLHCAFDYGLTDILVCCMPGKLLKYALGAKNTHAHYIEQDISSLARELDILLSLGSPRQQKDKTLINSVDNHPQTKLQTMISKTTSMREALEIIPHELHAALLSRLAIKALRQFCFMLGTTQRKIRLGILLINFSDEIFGWFDLWEGKISLHRPPWSEVAPATKKESSG